MRDGRFRLSGIGRDRIVDLSVEGPTIQSATIEVMTRAGARCRRRRAHLPADDLPGELRAFHSARTGAHRRCSRQKDSDADGRRRVCGHETNARTKTDEHGRYTLAGFPKNKSYGLMVLAGDKAPVFRDLHGGADTAGLEPIEANVDCRQEFRCV